jgi:hypothetical protein
VSEFREGLPLPTGQSTADSLPQALAGRSGRALQVLALLAVGACLFWAGVVLYLRVLDVSATVSKQALDLDTRNLVNWTFLGSIGLTLAGLAFLVWGLIESTRR